MVFQRGPAAFLLAASVTLFGSTLERAAAQDGVQTAQVEISFLPSVASKLPVKGFVVLRSGKDRAVPIRVPVTSSSTLSLKVPRGLSWEVSAELPGFWVPRKSLFIGSEDQPSQLTLDLWPMGTISGTVKFKEKGTPLPKQILVKTLAVPSFLKRPAVPKGALDCPVEAKGAWSCSLPATSFDLVISAEGSAPDYRWHVQVPAGKTLPLGTIELKRGASVAGWVAVEDGRIEPRRCVARLALLTAGGGTLRSSRRAGPHRASAGGPRGWFFPVHRPCSRPLYLGGAAAGIPRSSLACDPCRSRCRDLPAGPLGPAPCSRPAIRDPPPCRLAGSALAGSGLQTRRAATDSPSVRRPDRRRGYPRRSRPVLGPVQGQPSGFSRESPLFR